MRLLTACAAALAIACTSASAFAADAPAPMATHVVVNDGELFDRWLRASGEVASWRSHVGSARFDVLTAGVLPNPNLTASILQLADGENANGKTTYQAQLDIPLPIFGQVSKKRAAAEALVSVVEVAVMQQLWQRASELRNAMLLRAFSDAQREILDRALVELDRIEHIVDARSGAGANSHYDVLRVRTAMAMMRASRDNAIVARDRAEATLLSLIADPSLSEAPIERRGLEGFAGPEDENTLTRLASERRPDLAFARRSARANDAIAVSQRRSVVPVPSVFVGTNVAQGPYSFSVLGGVSLPLAVFDRNQGAIGRAENDADGQRKLAATLELRIRSEVHGAWGARRAAKLALERYRSSGTAAAAELLRRAEVTYQSGAFTITELFDAYQTVWDARTQELELERQMAEAEAALEHACALFWRTAR